MAEVADQKPINRLLGDIESSVNVGCYRFIMAPTHIVVVSGLQRAAHQNSLLLKLSGFSIWSLCGRIISV